jgi:hypothetical protein
MILFHLKRSEEVRKWEDGSGKWEDGSRKMEDGGWK